MKKNKIDLGIKQIRGICLTASEKTRVFNNIITNDKSVSSPYYSIFFSIKRSHFAYALLIIFTIVGTGGGVVFASQDSLPDDVLYPVKVKVVEPIRGYMIASSKEKALYESELASKRLIEAETLANKGTLDKNKEKKIDELLSVHTEALSKAIEKVNKEESKEDVNEIIDNFHADMNAHAKILDIIDSKNNIENDENVSNTEETEEVDIIEDVNENEDVSGLEDEVIQNNEPEASIDISNENLEKEINLNDKDELKINLSDTARASAIKIKQLQQNIENDGIDNYQIKKDNVKSIIEDTVSNLNDINSVIENIDKDPIEKAIIENTNKTIIEAEQLLNEAESQEKNGDQLNAYSKIIDSEATAKEANILLKNSLKIKDKKD